MALGKVVLAATDLSEAADEAIRQAHAYAKAEDGELNVCHVVPNVLYNNPLFPHRAAEDTLGILEAERQAASAVEDRVVQLTGRDRDDFSVLVDNGGPDAVVLRKAEEIAATLVVVGNRGRTGLERILLGSVAERIVRYAHCPVLVARPAPGKTTRILVATDLSEHSTPAIPAAAEVARMMGGEVVLFHAIDILPGPATGVLVPFGGSPVIPPQEFLDEVRGDAEKVLDGLLARFGVQGRREAVLGDAAGSILRRAEELSAELVVVATHGRTGIARLALGSVAERVVRSARCSVLVVRSS